LAAGLGDIESWRRHENKIGFNAGFHGILVYDDTDITDCHAALLVDQIGCGLRVLELPKSTGSLLCILRIPSERGPTQPAIARFALA
jgi:hypothetical protein